MRVDKSNDGISYKIKTLDAIKLLERTLNEYNSNEIFLSFNGGKDCTVLLHMFVNLFVTKYPHEKLMCLYIRPESPFDELEKFIYECEQKYPIVVEIVRGTVKGALFEICQKYPNLKACVMGCRRTDPYCADLNQFQNTDPGWPSLMRINPLLDWAYKDIWDYLNQLNVPYCSLYRRGYTSVGDRTNTKPNPFLRRTNAVTDKEEYLHAEQLINQDANERSGRF